MKTAMMTVMGCLAILMAGYTWAGCGDEGGGCGDGTGSSYESNCQCTDPSCNAPWDSDCTNRAYCCEAFGNVGGR